MRKMLAAFLFLACAGNSNAQTTVPFTFSAGSPARASEVNSNFQALVDGINSLTARVAKLEGQITRADLVGTYRMIGLFIELIPTDKIGTIAHDDTLTLAADGTYSGVLNGNGFAMNIPAGPRVPNTDIGPISGTWTFTANSVVLTGPLSGSFAHAAGGRILVNSGFDSNGVTDMFILLRSN